MSTSPENNTVNPEEISKFANLAHHWWDKEGALKTLHDINPARLDFISQYIDISGKRVLDVGCGGGILSESMAAKGALVTGIDAEREAINVASAHARDHHMEIEYLCTALEDYASTPFEVITCMELLEHTDNPQSMIHHCARLLKPGGYVFVSTINRTLKAYALAVVAAEYILGLLPKQTHEYRRFIKPADLAKMARNAGLISVGLQGMDYNPLNRSARLGKSVAVNYLMCFCPEN